MAATDFPEIAAITDYTSLVAALRAVREYRQISCETVELIAGMAKGHCSKVLAESQEKKIGPSTLGLILQSLGVVLVVQRDPIAEQKLGARWEPRNQQQVREPARVSQKLLALARPIILRELTAPATAASAKARRRQARNGNGHNGHTNGHAR